MALLTFANVLRARRSDHQCLGHPRGSGIRRLGLLEETYGPDRWRKLKGIGLVHLAEGTLAWAQLHCEEVHGIGRKRMKIKRFLD